MEQALADAKVLPPPKVWPSRHHAEVAVRRDKTPEPAAARRDGVFLSLSPFVRISLLMSCAFLVAVSTNYLISAAGVAFECHLDYGALKQATLQFAEEAYESANGTPRKDLVAGLKRFASFWIQHVEESGRYSRAGPHMVT